MTHTAIMKVTGGQCDKYLTFPTQAEADAHVAQFSGQYPDAYVVPTPSFPINRWMCNPNAKTVVESFAWENAKKGGEALAAATARADRARELAGDLNINVPPNLDADILANERAKRGV